MKQTTHYIFGYGSLVDIKSLKIFLGRDRLSSDDWQFYRLSSYRRIWNVAMDNQVDLPGYKYYIDPKTQIRPDVSVTFLNVYLQPESSIDGLLFQVSPNELKHVDRRERNYSRIDVSDKVNIAVDGKVWLYCGLPKSVERHEKAYKENKAVIAKNYSELVFDAFKTHGQDAASYYMETTDNKNLPQKELKLVKII